MKKYIISVRRFMGFFKLEGKKTSFSSVVFLSVSMLFGCTIPHSGPAFSDIEKSGSGEGNSPIPLFILDSDVTDILNSQIQNSSFSDAFGNLKPDVYRVNYGDSIDLHIWESAPALLFGSKGFDAEDLTVTVHNLPTQIVEEDGTISVPFVGMISVIGKTVRQVEKDILSALSSRANNPQVMVQISNRPSAQITVLGDVNSSKNILLTPKGETVLDAIALSAGVTQSFNKITLSLTRDGRTVTMPLERVIQNPDQNIYLNARDVLVVMYQPWSYTMMGASGKNQQFNFEATGINLIEALARAGGIDDNMADPRGVFVFRFEEQNVYDRLQELVLRQSDKVVNGKGNDFTDPDSENKLNGSEYSSEEKISVQNKRPVIYQVDFEQPESFFRSQNFMIKNGDVIFVASASGYELSKFLRMLGLIVNPALSWGNTINRMTN